MKTYLSIVFNTTSFFVAQFLQRKIYLPLKETSIRIRKCIWTLASFYFKAALMCRKPKFVSLSKYYKLVANVRLHQIFTLCFNSSLNTAPFFGRILKTFFGIATTKNYLDLFWRHLAGRTWWTAATERGVARFDRCIGASLTDLFDGILLNTGFSYLVIMHSNQFINCKKIWKNMR